MSLNDNLPTWYWIMAVILGAVFLQISVSMVVSKFNPVGFLDKTTYLDSSK